LYEYISSTTNDFAPLVDLKVLQPGGAPLSPILLQKLQALGVNIKTTYGTTETGPPLRTHTRDNPDVYRFRNLYPESPLVRMEPVGDDLFECVVYKGFPLAAELWLDSTSPNPYRTGDLFLESPSNSGYFVLQGRQDDILVHSNGEKTHATAMAILLAEDKASVVANAVVFGTGKLFPSVAVEIRWEKVHEEANLNIENAVWEVVQGCNRKAATHSRIPRKAILVLSKGEALPTTPKGNVRRNAAWELYGSAIESLYSHLLDGEPSEDDMGVGEPTLSLAEIIHRAVADVMNLPQEDISLERDWYEVGLDSIRAVELRSKLVGVFGSFPLMFIFEYPTVNGLLGFFDSRKKDSSEGKASIKFEHQERMKAVIQCMSRELDELASLPHLDDECERDERHVVYLTGANGALGNALLEVLVPQTNVSRRYCAVRGVDPHARLVESLRSRGYPEHLVQSDKICAVNYDMRNTALGLNGAKFELLAREVTIVMHNAWKLDFNQPLQQFERDCLRSMLQA
jgi:aryl carrier-like protein